MMGKGAAITIMRSRNRLSSEDIIQYLGKLVLMGLCQLEQAFVFSLTNPAGTEPTKCVVVGDPTTTAVYI